MDKNVHKRILDSPWLKEILHNILKIFVGRFISVGIATSYRLDGPGIDPRWGRDFPRPSRRAMVPTQPAVVGKAAGAWCCPLTPSSAEVKNKWSFTPA